MVGTFLFYFQYVDVSGAVGVRQRFREIMDYGDRNRWSYERIGQFKRQCAHIWDRTRFLPEREVLDLLSIPLQMEVVAMTRKNIVDSCMLIRQSSSLRRCLLFFATRLRLEMYVRGQQVYHFGEPTVGFFIVSEGAVQIMVRGVEEEVVVVVGGGEDRGEEEESGVEEKRKEESREEETKEEKRKEEENDGERGLGVSSLENRVVRPIGHFGAWSKKHNYRVDSAVAAEDSNLYRCSVEDMHEVMVRMSDKDASSFVANILV